MKKAGFFVVLLALFGICVWLGFQATISGISMAKTVGGNAAPTAEVQQNILVVRVDAFDSTSPKLISAWVIFAVSSQPSPSLTILPIYHYDGRYAQAMHLENVFALAHSGKPAEAFESAVLAYLNINHFDEYMTLDAQAATLFAQSFAGTQPTPQQYQVTALDDAEMISNLCSALDSGQGNGSDLLNWAEIVPDHFRTEMSFPKFMATWDIFTRKGSSPHCEIIAP